MKEELLQFIWENLLFDQLSLSTTAGAKVDIINTGYVQHGQGPDLLSAHIRLNGQEWFGAVEVHKRASEWYQHGHQHDPAYENVILHVVLEDDRAARTLSGRVLPTVELTERISPDALSRYNELMEAKGQVPCASVIGSVAEEHLNEWLDELLLRRLERKSQAIRRELGQAGNDRSEVFYRLVLSVFGLKDNVDPFKMLGNVLPLRLLQKYRDDHLKVQALLFGVAGMLQVNFVSEFPRRLQQEFEHLARAHDLRVIPVAAWKFGRMRPANFPTVRAALFAALLYKLNGSLNALSEASSLRELRGMLNVQASDEWNDRYTLKELSTLKPKRLGRTMQDLIIVNAVIPFLFASARERQDHREQERALALLGQMPSVDNTVLRAWRSIGLEAETMTRSQALLELRNEFCAVKKCLNCSIGMHLMQKTLA